jgi:hypothetical protein
MLKIIFSFFLFCCLLWQFAFGQSLQFLGEKIEVTIHEEHAVVNGEYHFKNNSIHAVRRTLFYPFVINDDLPYPDSVSVTHDEESIPFRPQSSGINFSITIPPESTAVYRVVYLQKTPANKMEYILTTTQRWRQPLRFAEYTVRMPSKLQLRYLSLPDPELGIRDDHMIYRIHKTNYMPKTNLRLEWARRKR